MHHVKYKYFQKFCSYQRSYETRLTVQSVDFLMDLIMSKLRHIDLIALVVY